MTCPTFDSPRSPTRRPQRATQLAATLMARPLTDWQTLIRSDDVDAVVIATPPATHAELALAALRAGDTCSARSRWPPKKPLPPR